MKPKLRFGHEAVHFDDGRTIIGSYQTGLGQQIPDPHAVVPLLNGILDGSRDIEEAVQEFCRRSKTSSQKARALINRLIELGHIEDTSASTSLSSHEQDRYSRSADYFGWITREAEPNRWAAQERLKATKACVLGVGGIGGSVALHLVAAGVGQVTVVDFDRVEVSNLNRQILFDTNDIGRLKIDAALSRLKSINPETHLAGYGRKICGIEDVVDLFNAHDILFRCADQPDELPLWVSDASLLTSKPWIESTYAGPIVNCCTFIPGRTGCYRCLREAEWDRVVREGKVGTYSDKVPQVTAAFGPVSAIAGALAAYEGIRLITHKRPESVGRFLHQNMYRYDGSYVIDIPPDCPHGEKIRDETSIAT